MATEAIPVILEGAKLLIQAYLNYARQAGLTEEQLEELYQSERKSFYQNNPENLAEPDPSIE